MCLIEWCKAEASPVTNGPIPTIHDEPEFFDEPVCEECGGTGVFESLQMDGRDSVLLLRCDCQPEEDE